VDLVRLGLGIRALRRRRGWRQKDLAAAAGVAQTVVSLIERGHADRVSMPLLRDVAAALDARLVLHIRGALAISTAFSTPITHCSLRRWCGLFRPPGGRLASK
jgi:transcriptional regulator with XRE-family HTH domain